VATKPASGVRFYGYRDYDPVTGRWPSRDPIGERGGLNLYGAAHNSMVSLIDRLGLQDQQDDTDGAGNGENPNWPEGYPRPVPNPRERGGSEPYFEPFNPGRDADGECCPCPSPIFWRGEGAPHGGEEVHIHYIIWNQAEDCACYPDRRTAVLPGDGWIPLPENWRDQLPDIKDERPDLNDEPPNLDDRVPDDEENRVPDDIDDRVPDNIGDDPVPDEGDPLDNLNRRAKREIEKKKRDIRRKWPRNPLGR